MATTAKKSKVTKKVATKKPEVKSKVKKTTAKKKATSLKSSVFIKSENKNDFLEQLSGIKQTKKNPKISTEPKLSLRNTLSVALLSPYRLPIDAEKLAMQSARIAGMAFVVIGALLTIFHLPAVNDELVQSFSSKNQSAQLLAFQSSEGCAGCEQHDYNNIGYTFSASLSISENIETQIYNIKISTQDASKIELRRIDSSGKVQLIDYAKQDGSTSWSYNWNVSNVPEGSYKVYAIVTNSRGVYDTSKKSITIKRATIVEDSNTDPTNTDVAGTDPNQDATSGSSSSGGDTSGTTSETLSNDFSITLASASNLSGVSEIDIKIDGASSVEVFVLPKNATTPRYLGLAGIKSKGEWVYRWNTANTPNGEYRLYAVAKLSSGKINSPYKSVKVANPILQQTNIEPVKVIEPVKDDIGVSTENSLEEPKVAILPPPPPPPSPLPQPYQETERQIAEVESEFQKQDFEPLVNESRPLPPEEDRQQIEKDLERLMSDYEVDIQNEIEKLKLALRSGDQNQVELVNKRIEELQNKIIKNSYSIGDENLLSFVGQRLNDEFSTIHEKVTYTERIIKERVGEEAFKDSDGDGITDYDETVIYKTDPKSADSDSDGFTDGSEVLNGYNPNDASPEAVVVFESPQNKGLERKDILAIKSIETVKVTPAAENNQAETTPAALIKGVGLPNSFVTLYIFSTPVIVTVKTDAEGSWEYTFDKELENGDHEVYVGVTDNAGSIVAKSEPLRFVKTAEAFTPIAQAEGAPEVTFSKSEPGFLTQNMILLVMSISVVIIGLVLMLLGLHLKTRRGEHLVQEGFAAST